VATGIPTKEEDDVSIWSTRHTIEPAVRDQYGREGDEYKSWRADNPHHLNSLVNECAVVYLCASGMSPLIRLTVESEDGRGNLQEGEVFLTRDEVRQLVDALTSVIQ
jgi:hypothetical protein